MIKPWFGALTICGGLVREGRAEMCNLMEATTAGTVGKEIQKGIF